MYFWAALTLWLCPDACTSTFLVSSTKAADCLLHPWCEGGVKDAKSAQNLVLLPLSGNMKTVRGVSAKWLHMFAISYLHCSWWKISSLLEDGFLQSLTEFAIILGFIMEASFCAWKSWGLAHLSKLTQWTSIISTPVKLIFHLKVPASDHALLRA